jgi:head-tail adaptor
MAKAGQLNERATFQRLTQGAVDDYGNVYTGWETAGSRPADLRERTGKEALEGGALADVSMATMRCRSDTFTDAITSADRVVVRGHTWAVKNAIKTDSKNMMVEFLLERGVAT